ncbi:MAG: PAS domain S-box protein [Methanolobus sp.]
MAEKYNGSFDDICELHESDQNEFKNLVNEMPLGILSCDSEGNITAVNDFLLGILGSPSAEATKKVNMLTFPPLVESGISSILDEALATGKPTSIETTYKSKWGKELFLSFRAFPLKNEKHETYSCHAIIEDITEKRKSKVEIDENKRKDNLISKISSRFINSNFKRIDEDIVLTLKDLAEFVSSDRASIFLISENKDYVIKTHEWNSSKSVSKVELNEKLDTRSIDFGQLGNFQIVNIPDISRLPDEKKVLSKFFEELDIKSVAMVPLSKDRKLKGSLAVFSVKKIREWNEKELYVLKIAGEMIASILERKETEELLLEKEKEYKNVISSLNSIIWKTTFDSEGNALETFISKSLDDIMGFPDGTVGNDWNAYFAHIHEEDFPEVQERLKKAFTYPGISESVDYRVVSDEGKVVWMNTLGNAHLLEDGNYLMSGTTTNITDRKLAEEKLRKNEALLNEVSQIGKIGGWEFDLESETASWTSELFMIHETDQVDSLEKGMERFPPGSREKLEKAFNDAMKKYEPYDLELEFISERGKRKWVRTIGKPIIENNRVVKLYGTLQDITERKNAEIKLIENEEVLRLFIEHAPVSLAMFDKDMKYIAVSKRWHSDFGLDGTNLEGLSHYKLFPEISEEIKEVHRRGLQGEVIHDDESYFMRADGSVQWLRWEVRPWKKADDTIGGIILFIEDITERKLAQDKLSENEEILRLFIEHAPVSLAMFDQNMRYMAVSKHWLSDLSIDNRNIIGMSHYDLLPQIGDEWKEIHQRALHGEVIVREEDLFRMLDGSEQWVHWEARPWRKADDTIGGIVIFAENITSRKETEELIRRNEEKYRALFEQSNDAILLLKKGGEIQETNSRALDIFEGTGDELLGMNIIDLVPPEMKIKAIQNLELFRKGKLEKFDFKAVTLKNNILDVEVNAKAIESYDNLAQVVIRDITKRKKAEENLKRNEKRYRALFEQSNDAIFLNHIDGRIVDVNEKACEMFGYTKEEFRVMNVVDLLAPEHIPAGSSGMEDFEKTGVAYVHTQYARSNGEVFDAEVKARVLEDHPDLAHAVVRDISDQKLAQETIIRSEAKYRSLFEKSNDAVLIHDFYGSVIDVNSKACEMFMYDEDELKQKSIMELVIPEEKEETIHKMKELRLKGSLRNESRMFRSDGKIIHVDISASMLPDKKLVQAVGRDITDRIKAEEAMLKAKIEAETASRTKSEFLANMSHELRTPLNSIIGFSDIMLEGVTGELGTKQEHYLDHISNSGRHLLNLINDILDISKVEAGKMDLRIELINIRSMIEEVVIVTQPLADKKELNVVLDIPENIPDIPADKAKFKQVIYNLLGNAVKFTDNKDIITITCKTANNKVIVSVKDTGIGISKEDQKKLFKPFSQIDSSISRKYEGTGLGLALVKEIVELHQGQIWVESETGKGSSFIFELPIDFTIFE